MHEGRWEVSEREIVNLFQGRPDEFGEMNLGQLVGWLDDLRGGFSRLEVFFKIDQWGDHWDGYSQAEITVWRYATKGEARAIEQERQEVSRQRAQDVEDSERAQLAVLKAKYEGRP